MIYVDIRNGVAPAERPDDLTSPLQTVWSELERCWERDPSRRPSAKDVKLSFLGGHSFIPDDVTEPPAPRLAEGSVYYDLQPSLTNQASIDYLASLFPKGGSQENIQVTSELTQFTAHQKIAAQRIYQWMVINPESVIPSSLITSEFWGLFYGGDGGWCLIGECALRPPSDRTMRMDHLHDHIRGHFGNRPFKCSVW